MTVESGRKNTSVNLHLDMDDQAQQSLDRVAAQCAEEFGCQISLVTALDRDQPYVLPSYGVEGHEMPCIASSCQSIARDPCSILVKDTKGDKCARSPVPLANISTNASSYLGVPLRHLDGKIVGYLSLSDSTPDRFTSEDIAKLQRYAEVFEDILKTSVKNTDAEELTRQISQQSEQLRKTVRIWQQVESIANIGTWELDIETNQLHWSDGIYAMHGFTDRPPVTVEEALGFYDVKDRDMVRKQVMAACKGGSPYCHDATLHALDGTMKRIRSRGECFKAPDGTPMRVVGVVQDISDAYQAELALRHAADHDPLTGLLNRSAFDRELQRRLDLFRTDGSGIHLALFDLDGFKDINDTFGHVTGDVFLRDTALRITRSAPKHCVVARWGGDEFAVIFPPHMTADEVKEHAKTMLDRIRQTTKIGEKSFEMSATVGLASAGGSICPKELVRHADTALYHGKRTDRASVQRYKPELDRQNTERQQAIEEVRDALRSDRLYAGYMPIVNLASGETVGFEALVRLTTQEGQPLTAAQVAPALIDPVLSRQVDETMLGMVAQEASGLFAAHPHLRTISVNATEGDLISQGFAKRFVAQFRQCGVDPALITLEVTETMLLVDQAERIQAVLHELRSHGVCIALDDFGTGYSSLTHLRDFPIDSVKLDLSFVQSMNEAKQSRSIVQAMIGMARSMGIKVVAEGVEREDQRAVLELMQCEYGQGYLFGKAMPVDDVIARSPAFDNVTRLRA